MTRSPSSRLWLWVIRLQGIGIFSVLRVASNFTDQFVRSGERTGPGKLKGFVNLGFDPCAECGQMGCVGPAVIQDEPFEFSNRAVFLGIDLVVRQVVAIYALMLHPAFGFALDESGLLLPPDIGNRLACMIVN